MVVYKCSKCKNEFESQSGLKRINRNWLCKECYKENRKDFRNKTIEESGIGNELKELKAKEYKEWYDKQGGKNLYYRNLYAKRKGYEVRHYNKDKENKIPIPKNSILKKLKVKSNCYMTLHEKQDFFKILVKRGIDAEEAKERIRILVNFENNLRRDLKTKNKTEEEINKQITNKKMELLEELWSY